MSVQWWKLLWLLTARRGVAVEVSSIIILACSCGYIRHFNRAWHRKQIAAFYISVSIGMVAMMGATLEDDILPVRRAVNSGMLLGAHEFALTVYSLNKGFINAHLFSLSYFFMLYALDPLPSQQEKDRVFVSKPFSIRTYLRFTYLVQLNYYTARGFGLLMNVLVDHDEKKSMVSCTAILVGAHAFSLFTPQTSQLLKDGVVIFGWDISRAMLFWCSFSYVRYFLGKIWSEVQDFHVLTL